MGIIGGVGNGLINNNRRGLEMVPCNEVGDSNNGEEETEQIENSHFSYFKLHMYISDVTK